MFVCRKFYILYNYSVRLYFFKLKNIFWILYFKGFFFCRFEIVCGVLIFYWEFGLDYDMEDLIVFILWSDDFFGNGNGVVMMGLFWSMCIIFGGLIIRNYGIGMFIVFMLFVYLFFFLDLFLFFFNGMFLFDGIFFMIEMYDSLCFYKLKFKFLSRILKIVWIFYYLKLKYYIERCLVIYNLKLWYFYYKWFFWNFFLKD